MLMNVSMLSPSVVRGGYVEYWYGSMLRMGQQGFHRSSTAYLSTSYAYYHSFTHIYVFPSSSNNRANAFSVRCLVL